jgi:hypothetical protein
MAGSVVVCSPLCFLRCKLKNCRPALLKEIVSSFYSVSALADAKKMLHHDLSALSNGNTVPACIARRDSPNRASIETDDLINLFTFADEQKVIDLLPVYTVSDINDIPGVRLFEGDMKPFLRQLELQDGKLNDVMGKLSAIFNDVKRLQHELNHGAGRPVGPSVTAPVSAPGSFEGPSTGIQSDHLHLPGPQFKLSVTRWPPLEHTATSSSRAGKGNELSSVTAELTSSQVESDHSHGRVGMTSAADTDGDTDNYTLAESRRKRRKRLRNASGSVRNGSGDTRPTTATKVLNKPSGGPSRSGKCLVVGKCGSGNIDSGHLSAAKHFRSANVPSRKKAVFCIDNLCLDVTSSDVMEFVSTVLGVEVLSLFEVKPRKRRFDPDGKLRRAFRICIYEDSTPAFLVEDKWPNRVAVYAWFSRQEFGQFVNLVNSPSSASQLQPGVSVGSSDVISMESNVAGDVITSGAGSGVCGASIAVDVDPLPTIDKSIFADHPGGGEWADAMDLHDKSPAADRASSPNGAPINGLNETTLTAELNDTTLTADISAISDVTALGPLL